MYWLLGYTLFFDPLPLEDYWLLLALPLVAGISIVYKSLKIHDLSNLPGKATVLMTQIISFMMMAAAILWLISEVW